MFDVTNPANPKYVKSIGTECGSHTHTLVPDRANGKLYIYVSSYPLGSGITPADYTGDLPRCAVPHKKISIITVPFGNPQNTSVKKQALSDDTTPYSENEMQACHDIQVFAPKKFAVGSCAGDTQVWDISNPANPGPGTNGKHTHIRSPGQGDQFEFMHSGVLSAGTAQKMATMDETGGGGAAECDGKASQDGFYYFYKVPKPGDPAPKLESRFTIPRDADAGDLRVAQRERDPDQEPRCRGRVVLPGRQHGDRLHGHHQAEGDRLGGPRELGSGWPTRGPRTGTTAACT